MSQGRSWNGILLGKRLGSGFSSDVYSIGEGRALKLVDLDDQRPPHNVQNEIKILQKIKGKSNVLELHEVLTRSDEIGLVVTQCEVSLTKMIQSNIKKKTSFLADGSISYAQVNQLPLDSVRRILGGVLSGLEWIHLHGIIHRDINPNNIMFLNDYEPVIIDFGISYQIPNNHGLESDDKKYTDVATGYYKAPELLLSKRDYSFEVDMWALGIVMCQLGSINGNVPYEEDSQHSDLVLLSQILKTFGSPAKDWPECAGLESFEAMNRTFFDQEAKSPEEVVPRLLDDKALMQIWKGLTKYSKRMSAKEALKCLA